MWKRCDGEVRDNGLSYTPNSFACGIDWSLQPEAHGGDALPIRELLSTQNAGCSYNCPWCGGSRDAFRRINRRRRAMARNPQAKLVFEFDTMNRLVGVGEYSFYSVGSCNESKRGMESFLDQVARTPLMSVSYEQYHLTPDDILRRMAAANRHTTITLSPESHDLRVSKLVGRGVYTNDELERWLPRALDAGIALIDIWYFVGMPEQDRDSVMETVEYCERLLTMFKGRPVNPTICPMIPFLDPASTFFEEPERNGYRIFHGTAEQHRRGMERASIIHRINYEARWLSRPHLVKAGFSAVRRLMEAKASVGMLPRSVVRRYVAKIDDALQFIGVVHEADAIADPGDRTRAIAALGDEILRRNRMILHAGVMNQAVAIHRQIGGRWFDEMGWEAAVLAAAGEVPHGAGTALAGVASGPRGLFPMQHGTQQSGAAE